MDHGKCGVRGESALEVFRPAFMRPQAIISRGLTSGKAAPPGITLLGHTSGQASFKIRLVGVDEGWLFFSWLFSAKVANTTAVEVKALENGFGIKLMWRECRRRLCPNNVDLSDLPTTVSEYQAPNIAGQGSMPQWVVGVMLLKIVVFI